MATEWRLRTSVSHVGGAMTSAEQLQAMGRRRQKGCFFVFRSQKAEKEHTKKSCVAVRITSWVHTGLLHGDCLPHRGSKGFFFRVGKIHWTIWVQPQIHSILRLHSPSTAGFYNERFEPVRRACRGERHGEAMPDVICVASQKTQESVRKIPHSCSLSVMARYSPWKLFASWIYRLVWHAKFNYIAR